MACFSSKMRFVAFLTAITITTRCTGVITDASMFEIPAKYQKRFLLTDCHRTVGDNCRCIDLRRECIESDTHDCQNCRCLSGNSRTFYIRKSYGGICLSANNLQNAAGFGETFLIYHEGGKVCARIGTKDNGIYKTNRCNTSDLRQVWFWTPGNLVMNALTLKCFDVHTKVQDYRPVVLSSCNSSVHTQNFKCNNSLFGISSQKNPTQITYAIRYFSRDKKLKARTVKIKDSGNWFTRYPTNNYSICSARSPPEGVFNLDENGGSILQIDLVPRCSMSDEECHRRLYTSSIVRDLSNCTVIWKEPGRSGNQRKEFFALENRGDGVYLKWKSNPYSSLAGTLVHSTIECLDKNTKFQEFMLSFRVKDVNRTMVPGCYQFTGINSNESNIPAVDLNKGCLDSVCSTQLEAPIMLDKNNSVCAILWNESTITDNMSSWTSIANEKQLFSLKKVANKSWHLQWSSSDSSLLQGSVFNLTIFCYDDRNQNSTFVEQSCLIFQTEYGEHKMASSGTQVPLEIVLPAVFLLIVILVVISVYFCCRRKHRSMKSTESKANLQNTFENQYSSEMSNLGSEHSEHERAEDNPVYERCTATTHPVVTIARNKLYEDTVAFKQQRPYSDIYEKPVQSVKISKQAFERDNTTKPDPGYKKPKIPPMKAAQKKNTNPDKNTKQPDHHEVEDAEGECYDQPLSFIKNSRKNHKNGINNALSVPSDNNYDNRLSAPYNKPLPLSPEDTDYAVYDYATREDVLEGVPASHPTRMPLDFPTKDTPLSKDVSKGIPSDGPLYDVLDHTYEIN